jgi:alkylation response protein AidB-like acyl-CoA dehydrogenase
MTVLDRAAALADALASLAGGVDSGTVSCTASFDLVKDAGFLRLLIPRDADGEGLSFLQCTRVLEVLGTRDAATALGLNMHNVSIAALCETAGRPLSGPGQKFRDWVFDEVVNWNRMFASATSEAGTGAKLRAIRTTYTAAGDGFVLNGRKSFVSLAGIADYYMVAARSPGADGDYDISHVAVSRADPGVGFGDVWTGTAMAGTSTADMTFDHVPVGRERLVLGVEGMSLFKLVREPHWMVSGYTGVYLGLAAAILAEIIAAVSGDPARMESPVVRREVGRLSARLRAARALTYSACADVDSNRGGTEANAAVHAAKYTVGELLHELAVSAVTVCGARSLDRRGNLERYLRESFFCSVMPAKADDCLEYLGKASLGVNMRDVRSFNW